MTTGRHQIEEWADECRAGRLSRRHFGQRLLVLTGSVPVALAVMRGLGIDASAEEIDAAARRRRYDVTKEILRCSFCNKNQNDVRKLIAGPTVFICDECVLVCNDIIDDDTWSTARGAGSPNCSLCGSALHSELITFRGDVCRQCDDATVLGWGTA